MERREWECMVCKMINEHCIVLFYVLYCSAAIQRRWRKSVCSSNLSSRNLY